MLSSSGEIPFNAEGATMPTGNLTLKAKWLDTPHTVRFFENGTATEPIDSLTQTVENGKLVTQPADLDNLADGTEFIGWYTKLSNGTFMPYSFETPVTGSSDTPLDLYARWYPAYKPYRVVYDKNGGTLGSVDSDENRYALGSKAIVHDGSSLKTADGKVFIGWKLGDSTMLYHESNKIDITSGLANAEQVITLTAQYAKSTNAVSITFKRNAPKSDGVFEEWVTVQNARVIYPSGNQFDGFPCTGYTFSGWATTSAGPVDSSYSSGNSGKLPVSITLYAVWKPINYTVKYLPGAHGTFAEKVFSGLQYLDGVAPNTPAAPTSTTGEAGWKFDGWDKAISSKVTGNATYTALWSKLPTPPQDKTGDISYDGGSGDVTGIPSGATTVKVGDSYTVSTAVPSRDGYTFSGWTVIVDGVSRTYHGGDSFIVKGDTVLTAIWTKVSVTPPADDTAEISYVDGGEGVTGIPSGSTVVKIGDRYTIPSISPSRDGYTFGGWTVIVDGVSRTYHGGDSFVVTGDTVLTAVWTAVAVAEDIAEPKEPEVPAPTVTKESVDVRLANQTGNPILDVLNGNVPLGGFATKGAWSLLSLLMSLVAVVVSVLLVVGIFMRRRDDDDEGAARFDEDSEEDDRRRRGKILKTFTIIVGILTPIVWLILDNLNQPMVWINNWTVFVGITFIVHIALLVVYKLRKGNEEKEEEDNAEVA
jgi:uncharacterized repeat protein (TIGR02543 family)